MDKGFYDFSAVSLQGKEIQMESYRGKVIIIVNTASKCGFTPQYEGLENLYRKFGQKGLVILGFPCNQFGNQEPGSEKEIAEGCVINYGVTFQMFSKVEVNGKNAHPLFQYLKNKLPGIAFTRKIKWNFTKFLIDRKGIPVKRYPPTFNPESMEADIERLLAETT
jgi:glutathione peroxidase